MTKIVEDSERHRAKMAKRKAVQDSEVAGKTVEKGLLIVHTGPGKGKSTAAFGLAVAVGAAGVFVAAGAACVTVAVAAALAVPALLGLCAKIKSPAQQPALNSTSAETPRPMRAGRDWRLSQERAWPTRSCMVVLPFACFVLFSQCYAGSPSLACQSRSMRPNNSPLRS